MTRTKHYEKFKVNFINTKRYFNSTIPILQRFLNNEELERKSLIETLVFKIFAVPTNNVSFLDSISL